MKKNRTLDKNQIVVVCLFLICVLLVFIIFFVSNHVTPAGQNTQSIVNCEDVKEAYDFLNQDEAVNDALNDQSDDAVFTYGAYRDFLEQLHLWDAVSLESLLDWDRQKDEGVSPEMLEQSRDMIAELFETTVAKQQEPEETVLPEMDVSQPCVDANTKIRVLLLQNGSPLAEEIRFSANEAYEIVWKGKTKEKKKNQVIRASQLHLSVGQTAVIRSENGEVYLADAQGKRDTLGYSGDFRITRYADGYAVVNEVKIEDYLYGVVQSEMPAYFEKEALKAQAVCARTYIVTQLMQENYPQYEADVDDSVRYQVYNQAAPDARVVEAVDETRGKILTKDGLPIHAYFFSTSHGVTSGREIWGLSDLDYLQPVQGNVDRSMTDLSDEDTFRAYIREKDADDYDAASAYYRWKATLDIADDPAAVKTLLKGIDETQPDCVIINDSGGRETTVAKMDTWEKPQQLKVLERTASGAVSRLLIVYNEGKVELSNENYIRQLLGIWMCDLQDKDGNRIQTSGMLPSVYFYVQPIKKGIVLFGGGLGHGIGMSQYGANGLAKQGADMSEILNFYYQDVSLEQLYSAAED